MPIDLTNAVIDTKKKNIDLSNATIQSSPVKIDLSGDKIESKNNGINLSGATVEGFNNQPIDLSSQLSSGLAGGISEQDNKFDSSFWERFKYGLDAHYQDGKDIPMRSDIGAAETINKALFPNTGKGTISQITPKDSVYVRGQIIPISGTQQQKEEAEKISSITSDEQNTAFENRLKYINEKESNILKEKYSTLSPEEKKSGAALLGNIVKSLYTPTTLLPFGAASKGKFLSDVVKFSGVSGLWGAEYSALTQLADKGNIDPIKLRNDSLIAAGGGTVYKAGLEPLAKQAYKGIKTLVVDKTASNLEKRVANSLLDDIEYTAAKYEFDGMPANKIPNAVKTKLNISNDTFNKVLNITKNERKFNLNIGKRTEDELAGIIVKREGINIDYTKPAKSLQSLDHLVGITHTQMKKISEPIAGKMQRFEKDIHVNPLPYLQKVKPFINIMKNNLFGIKKADKRKISAALFNRKYDEAGKILSKYTQEDVLTPVRETLDSLYNNLEEKGIRGLNYIESYFPRKVADLNAIKERINKIDYKEGSALTRQLAEEKAKKGTNLTEDEIEKVIRKRINSILHKTKNKEVGNFKTRKINTIYDEILEHYETPELALVDYIHKSINTIAKKDFFGTSAVTDDLLTLDTKASISKFMANETRLLPPEAFDEVEYLLTARFGDNAGEQGTDSTTSLLKNTIYGTHLSDPTSAIQQMGDMPITAFMQGIFNLPRGLVNLFSKNNIKVSDIGLDNFSAEVTRPKGWASILSNYALKFGFSQIDRFNKSIYLNSAFSKVKSQLTPNFMEKKKGLPVSISGYDELKKDYYPVFGEEFNSFVDAVQRGDIKDENVVLYLWSELSKAQPISLSEMPPVYLNKPHGRLFYTLKSFTLKQLDIMRNSIYEEARKGNALKATKNAAVYTLLVTGVGNTGIQQINNMISGRGDYISPDSVSDDFVSNILKQFFLSRYTLDRYGAKGDIPQMLIDAGLPPYTWASSIMGDLFYMTGLEELINPSNPFKFEDKKHRYKSIKLLPFGKTIYNRAAGGNEDFAEKKYKESLKLD